MGNLYTIVEIIWILTCELYSEQAAAVAYSHMLSTQY